MAHLEKYQTGFVAEFKHCIREFENGKCTTNPDIDPDKSHLNYSIIRRGQTSKEIEAYRVETMKEIFHYDRKNIVKCNEIICTLPRDCPPDQEKLFFEESYKYIVSTLPLKEKSILIGEVHYDEGNIRCNGKIVADGRPHLHVMYIPAVPDSKHEGFEYKLCSDQLTKRSIFKQWHPNYQKWIDDAGVHATVASGVTDGKNVSVKTLKEISRITGFTLEELKTLDKENRILQEKNLEKDFLIENLKNFISDQNKKIDSLKEQLHSKDIEISQKNDELSAAKVHIEKLESKTYERTWGDNTWGKTSWGSSRQKSYEKEY